jgi:hypothetical protein
MTAHGMNIIMIISCLTSKLEALKVRIWYESSIQEMAGVVGACMSEEEKKPLSLVYKRGYQGALTPQC